MSNYLIQGETLTNIANAIRTKTGKTDSIPAESMASEISGISSGGGLTINGIIEQYKVRAGKTLNAGDFVEFTKFWLNDEIPLESDHIYYNAVALTESKVVLLAKVNTSPYNIKIFVLEIEGDSLSVKSETVLDNVIAEYSSLVALTENKILVVYQHYVSSSSGRYGKAFVLTINSDNSIAVGTTIDFYPSYTTAYINACKLSESKVLVAFSGNPTPVNVKAIVLTISGTTITLGSLFTLEAGADVSATTLTSNKVLLCYRSSVSSPYYQKAVVLTISGTTITAGTSFQYTESTGSYITVGKLTETKALVVYADSTNSNYGTAQILTISGTTITGGNPFVFLSSTYIYRKVLAVLNDTTAVILWGQNSSLGYMRVITLTIANSDITSTVIDFEESYGTYRVPITLTSDKCLLITEPYSNSYNVRTRIVEVNNGTLETFATPTDTVINGIANTSGTAGETVEVYVPN